MKHRIVSPLIGLAIVVAISSHAISQDRRPDKSKLTIMTFNVEFMWDGVMPEQGDVDFSWKNSQTEAEERMQELAAVIIRSDPDIINLVEVENLDALETLNQKFLSGRGYKAYLVEGTDTKTGQDVGLLTRLDPEGSTITRDPRKGLSGNVWKSVSKNYVARFTIGDTKLALIGLHFLAFPNDATRRYQRQAQADAIRLVAIDQVSAGYLPVVLGDFNDYDGEDCCRDHINSTPTTTVLTTLKWMKQGEVEDDLVNVASFIPQSLRYTSHWDANRNGRVDFPDEFTSIDHILISNKLVSKVEAVNLPHDHNPLTLSDHFPVVVTLKMGTGVTGQRVVMTGLLPNPPGSDNENEEIKLRNTGSQAISMNGWKVRDLKGKTWALDGIGTLSAGQEVSIKRLGQPMAMNNDGDTIELVDPSGTLVHSITYVSVDEGEWVTPIP